MKNILLIHTGGTMGMPLGEGKPVAAQQFADEVFRHVPDLKSIANIDLVSPFNIDSSNISIPHWITLGQEIASSIDRYDGFVIIHGTDTMSYTACALSYMLTNLPKPVILTGSQRRLSDIRTDAKNNLINSIELATYDIPEVGIFFDYKLFRGNRTKKTSIDQFDAFASPNFPTLAEVGLRIDIKNIHRKPTGIFRLDRNFSKQVTCLRLFPGFDPVLLDAMLTSSVQVTILEGFGSGNVPILEDSVVPFVRQATENGKLVAIASQCINGNVSLDQYECGKQAAHAGAISCLDMTTEAAVIKAMYLLGQFGGDLQKVRSNFLINLAGELSDA